MEMLSKAILLDGNAIELGVGEGLTSFPMADLLLDKAPEKVLYLCDTFEGFPYDDCYTIGHRKGEFCEWGMEFNKKFDARNNNSNIVIVKGLIEDTLSSLPDQKFCFAWVDLDLHIPTYFAYKFLEDRMVVGGIIGFHDYAWPYCPGVKNVVDEEVNKDKYDIERVFGDPHYSAFLRRK